MPEIAGPAPDASLGSYAAPERRSPSPLLSRRELLHAGSAACQHHDDPRCSPPSPADLASAPRMRRGLISSRRPRISLLAAIAAASGRSFYLCRFRSEPHWPQVSPRQVSHPCRAWLHVNSYRCRCQPPGSSSPAISTQITSIAGNLNDIDPARYSPHYTTDTAPDQVQIF